jgi:CRP-like cAMP-binding protein
LDGGARGGTLCGSDGCATRGAARTCLGCPAEARGLLLDLVAAPAGCAFESHAIEAREPVPAAYMERSGFAIVRRGYLIREHVDVHGGRTAIDVVGPGSCFVLDRAVHATGEHRLAAYAVTRVLLCTCPEASISAAIERGGREAPELYALVREARLRGERLAAARARSSAGERVSALLCALADSLSSRCSEARIPAEFQYRDLSHLISLRHESVCRVMRGFTSQGLIARDADGIAIRDRARLERVGSKAAR